MEVIHAPYQSLAIHYDIPHIDLHRLLKSSFMEGPLAEELGISRWQLLSRLYMDNVHLQRQDLGPLLVADVLVNWLYKMQEALPLEPLAQQPAAETEKAYRLPPAVHGLAEKQHISRCFGVSFEQVLRGASQAAAAAASEEEDSGSHKEALDALSGASEDFFGGAFRAFGAAAPGASPMHSLPSLNVVKMEGGFQVQGYYRGKGGAMKFKPGYLASAVGAVLDFELSTAFPEVAGAADAPTEVVITYTSGYDGWGVAAVSCLAGCDCTGTTVDAANTKGHESVLRSLVLKVTQHADCRVRVEVAPQTTSGGHRFKVSSVMARVLV